MFFKEFFSHDRGGAFLRSRWCFFKRLGNFSEDQDFESDSNFLRSTQSFRRLFTFYFFGRPQFNQAQTHFQKSQVQNFSISARSLLLLCELFDDRFFSSGTFIKTMVAIFDDKDNHLRFRSRPFSKFSLSSFLIFREATFH